MRGKQGGLAQRQLWGLDWGPDHCQGSLFAAIFPLCFSLFVGLILLLKVRLSP